mmetsp:Transcript_5106/g.7817  ORF Transcript_5106/g.7817 Transcript_5106/m.7817 type:complete len:814 (-) Transcript_5106:54-2495(-)
MSSYPQHEDAVTEERMVIMPLGGGQEVGRSCLLLKYRGRTILLDCGSHPGREGMDSFPFFDMVEPDEVDLILITHFHIDHCASLPYFTEKTNFKGRIFMTHATKAVMRILVSDTLKLLGSSRSGALYTDADLLNCIDKIEVLDYHRTVEHKGIKFCAYVAGHVLGAAMFTISIDGVVVLYTGDYSMEEDRHLMPAEVPPDHADVLIVESTYGTINHSSRAERESRFTSTVSEIVRRGGNCLIPVFATGRAQELLLILDEFWRAAPDLQQVPIFYASRVASKALRVYQTFVNMMNLHIQALMDIGNPFHFNYIENMKNTDTLIHNPMPCVVMASPGMLQSGVSRELFERWCEDERNGVVLAGYSVEGTLAKKLLSEPEEITCLDGRIKKRNCSIEYISFSAHVDYIQNSRFIRSVVPDNILLVHGEPIEMGRLKGELDKDIARSWPDSTHTPPVVMPKNGQPVSLTFSKPILADVVGETAATLLEKMERNAEGGEEIVELPDNTLLVTEDFESKLVSASDIATHTSCRIGRIQQRMVVPLPGVVLQLREHNHVSVVNMLFPRLHEVFDDVKYSSSCTTSDDDIKSEDSKGSILIQEEVSVEEEKDKEFIVVAWVASPVADVIADCALGVIFQSLSAAHYIRSCWKDASLPSALSCDKRHAHKHGPDISDEFEDPETCAVVKRMKLGLIDPSRAFNTSSNGDGERIRNGEEFDIEQVKKNRPKLEKIQSYLRDECGGDFSDVKIGRNGLRLIVRSDKLSSQLDVPAEAYVYIHWAVSRGQHTHHAVVQCPNECMRKKVSEAIQQMESGSASVASN